MVGLTQLVQMFLQHSPNHLHSWPNNQTARPTCPHPSASNIVVATDGLEGHLQRTIDGTTLHPSHLKPYLKPVKQAATLDDLEMYAKESV